MAGCPERVSPEASSDQTWIKCTILRSMWWPLRCALEPSRSDAALAMDCPQLPHNCVSVEVRVRGQWARDVSLETPTDDGDGCLLPISSRPQYCTETSWYDWMGRCSRRWTCFMLNHWHCVSTPRLCGPQALRDRWVQRCRPCAPPAGGRVKETRRVRPVRGGATQCSCGIYAVVM